jgi:hypothetical protein
MIGVLIDLLSDSEGYAFVNVPQLLPHAIDIVLSIVSKNDFRG